MLVLSRKENTKIVLPDLGVSIQVLKIKGGTGQAWHRRTCKHSHCQRGSG